MARIPFRVNLDRRARRRLLTAVLLLNAGFAVTTTMMELVWGRMDEFSQPVRNLIRYVLVQGHLSTENVIAVWYSSMLLLGVAALSAAAWTVDTRRHEGPLRHGWLGFVAVFTLLSLDELGSIHERVGMIPVAGGQVLGWIYLLALPIAVTSVLMVVFGAIHLRRVPQAFTLIAIGVGLYVLNPISEDLELAMNQAGAAVWTRISRALVEEVVLELTGTLCFAAGVCEYVATRSGERLEWDVPVRTLRLACWLIIGTLTMGVRASLWLDEVLPAGDPGMAQNWFPAVAWMLVAAVAVTAVPRRRWQGLAIAVPAVALSAFLGVGLYLYSDLLASRASWAVPTITTLAAGVALEAMLHGYLFSFSPRSSTASPTLRRPRPRPS
ncbi:MAG TPA: hypothetical protein VGD94_00025 [Vicinamibacterales bacterium]